jgi:hypothetical protein
MEGDSSGDSEREDYAYARQVLKYTELLRWGLRQTPQDVIPKPRGQSAANSAAEVSNKVRTSSRKDPEVGARANLSGLDCCLNKARHGIKPLLDTLTARLQPSPAAQDTHLDKALSALGMPVQERPSAMAEVCMVRRLFICGCRPNVTDDHLYTRFSIFGTPRLSVSVLV